MVNIFSSFTLKNITLKNRFVRSATTSYWSQDDGVITPPIINYYELLAKGGIGLIIKGHSYIMESGKAHSKQSGLSNKKHVPEMRRLTEIVHKHGSKIFAQLNHGGYTSKPDRATASEHITDNWKARELEIEEIENIISSFANAAELAIEAGFDGVQIHAAHGYLVSQFLSDRVNKREDEYGGSLEKRAKILLDIYTSIRDKIGDKPIGMKINVDDFAPEGGMRVNDSIKVILMLKEVGLDFVELSGGGPEQNRELRKTRGRSSENSSFSEATWGGHAQKIRKVVKEFPLALVDGIRSRETMNHLLDKNIVDLISMSKPFIHEPDLVHKLELGLEKAGCIDCFKCISRENFAKTMLRCFYLNP